MTYAYENFVIEDFSGGLTDKYIGTELNQYTRADNFLVTEYGSLKLRDGYDVKFEQNSKERINGLFKLNDDIFFQRAKALLLLTGSVATNVATPHSNLFFEHSNDVSFPSAVSWRDQLHLVNSGVGLNLNRPMLVWRDDVDAIKSKTIGLPNFDGTNITDNSSSGTTVSYLYKFLYSTTYKVGDVTYINKSDVHFYGQVEATASPDTTAITFSNLPIISTSVDNYNTSTMVVECYRTIDGGIDAYYKVGEVAFNAAVSGVLSFEDDVSDVDLVKNQLIYESDGLLEFGIVPKCKFMTVVGDTAFYAHVVDEDGEYRPYRYYQSMNGIPAAVNPSYFDDVDDDIVGMNHVDGVPIIFTKSFIYRIEGKIGNDGSGGMRKKVISSTVGCVSNGSIIKANGLLYFGGLNGFYVTNGFDVTLLTPQLATSYLNITSTESNKERINAEFDEEKNLIYWSVTEDNDENDTWWIMNIPTARFTKANGSTFFSTALLYTQTELLRADNQGYIYSHRREISNDLLRDSAIAVSLWEKTHIAYNYTSVAFDFGHPSFRKWVPSMSIGLKSTTPIAIKPYSINDDSGSEKAMASISIVDRVLWGDPNATWGNPDILWSPPAFSSKKRRFPRKQSRCRLKQIVLKPDMVNLFRSDIIGEADLAAVGVNSIAEFTATISTPAGVWPEDCVGYFLSVSTNDYSTKHLITARSNTTITCNGGGIPLGNAASWIIDGYYKEQDLEIKSINFNYAPLGDLGTLPKDSEIGGNV